MTSDTDLKISELPSSSAARTRAFPPRLLAELSRLLLPARSLNRVQRIKAENSVEETIKRFDTPAAAAKYASSLGGTATHKREVRSIFGLLEGTPQAASLLDLPCGTGRLLPELSAQGFRVTAADSSPHMVELARQHTARSGLGEEATKFRVASVLGTGFGDDEFDAVVCNRLFHHFREPALRVQALAELRRICRGPIVVSFFCNWSLDAAIFHLRQTLRHRPAKDRIPIGRAVFARDIAAAGLRVRKWRATRPGVSKQWYVLLDRA